MILPLFGGMSEIELMNALLGRPKIEGPELVQETFRASAPPGEFDTAWSQLLRDGFASHLVLKEKAPTFNSNNAGGVAHTLWSTAANPTLEAPEIVLTRSYSMDDGRYINNGWLQELPDPVTKLTWDNAALMSRCWPNILALNGDLKIADERRRNANKNRCGGGVMTRNLAGSRGQSISIHRIGRKEKRTRGRKSPLHRFCSDSSTAYRAVDGRIRRLRYNCTPQANPAHS